MLYCYAQAVIAKVKSLLLCSRSIAKTKPYCSARVLLPCSCLGWHDSCIMPPIAKVKLGYCLALAFRISVANFMRFELICFIIVTWLACQYGLRGARANVTVPFSMLHALQRIWQLLSPLWQLGLGVPSAFLRGIMWSRWNPAHAGSPQAQQHAPLARTLLFVVGEKECLGVIARLLCSCLPIQNRLIRDAIQAKRCKKTRFLITKMWIKKCV